MAILVRWLRRRTLSTLLNEDAKPIFRSWCCAGQREEESERANLWNTIIEKNTHPSTRWQCSLFVVRDRDELKSLFILCNKYLSAVTVGDRYPIRRSDKIIDFEEDSQICFFKHVDAVWWYVAFEKITKRKMFLLSQYNRVSVGRQEFFFLERVFQRLCTARIILIERLLHNLQQLCTKTKSVVSKQQKKRYLGNRYWAYLTDYATRIFMLRTFVLFSRHTDCQDHVNFPEKFWETTKSTEPTAELSHTTKIAQSRTLVELQIFHRRLLPIFPEFAETLNGL